MLQFIVEAVAEILRNAGYLKTSHVTVYPGGGTQQQDE